MVRIWLDGQLVLLTFILSDATGVLLCGSGQDTCSSSVCNFRRMPAKVYSLHHKALRIIFKFGKSITSTTYWSEDVRRCIGGKAFIIGSGRLGDHLHG